MALEKLTMTTPSTATPPQPGPASVTTSAAPTPRTPQESLAYGSGLVLEGRGQVNNICFLIAVKVFHLKKKQKPENVRNISIYIYPFSPGEDIRYGSIGNGIETD